MEVRLYVALTFLLMASLQCTVKEAPSEEADTRMQSEFSWVLDQRLAGMPRPGSGSDLKLDLAFLNQMGIGYLVSLTEAPLDAAELEAFSIGSLHLPVEDFHPPTLEQLNRFVGEVSREIDGGIKVGVHCAAGKGRTGTFLAAYFVSEGKTAAEAMDEVRRLRPGSIETEEQEQSVIEYARSLVE